MDTEVANTADMVDTVVKLTDVVHTDVMPTDTNSTVMTREVTVTGAKWSMKLHLSTTHLSDPNKFITKSTNSTLCQCQLM